MCVSPVPSSAEKYIPLSSGPVPPGFVVAYPNERPPTWHNSSRANCTPEACVAATHNCGGRPCYEGMETLAKLNQCQVNDVLRTLALSLVICRRLCFLVQNLQISTLVTPT